MESAAFVQSMDEDFGSECSKQNGALSLSIESLEAAESTPRKKKSMFSFGKSKGYVEEETKKAIQVP